MKDALSKAKMQYEASLEEKAAEGSSVQACCTREPDVHVTRGGILQASNRGHETTACSQGHPFAVEWLACSGLCCRRRRSTRPYNHFSSFVSAPVSSFSGSSGLKLC